MIRKCVEDLGAREDVETDEEDVVGEEHEAAEFVCDLALPECVVSEITCCSKYSVSYAFPVEQKETEGVLGNAGEKHTDIFDLWMLHDEFVHRNGGDPEEYTSKNHSNYPWNPSQDTGKNHGVNT